LELEQTGTLKELDALLAQTPTGVIEMLGIKGIGTKKVSQLWTELGVESPGELLYACKENRLVDLKGFGSKTQASVKKAIEFNLASKGRFHYAAVEHFANDLVDRMKKKLNTNQISLTGAIRRKAILIDEVDILAAVSEEISLSDYTIPDGLKIKILYCQASEFSMKLFESTGSAEHLASLGNWGSLVPADVTDETKVYSLLGMQYIVPELREGRGETALAREHRLPVLVQESDLKGVLHNHSTWSDGAHSLTEMAEHAKELGYEYLGICDHSQSAFYANGLKPDRVLAQHIEIDELNKRLAPFKIFKGIESDILFDGSLDYSNDILSRFDFVVASIHSVLKMDEQKATARLIRAIENPYTTILGHPTGRLLLSREGYPVNHLKVIEACAKNNVVIELNAHPYRLDIDWSWIQTCIEMGVKIAINPDAHEKQGYQNMYYGVCAARKGMLSAAWCFNAQNRDTLSSSFASRKAGITV
jgi:DNA polymerase (family 10)